MKSSFLKDILFKPLTASGEGASIVIFPFAAEDKQIISVSSKGKKVKLNICVLHIINITDTINNGSPIIEQMSFSDINLAQQNLKVITDPHIYEDIGAISQSILYRMSELSAEMELLNNSVNALSSYINDGKQAGSEGSLILVDQDQGVFDLTYRTIDGSSADFKDSDIKKLADTISEIIVNNRSLDVSNADNISRIVSEIKYRLIDALPAHISVNEIKINTDGIIDEIRALQNGEDE